MTKVALKTKDDFYLEWVNDPNRDFSHYMQNKMLIHLVKDVYVGYENENVISEVLNTLNLSKDKWNSYVYAYRLFKKYEKLSS